MPENDLVTDDDWNALIELFESYVGEKKITRSDLLRDIRTILTKIKDPDIRTDL